MPELALLSRRTRTRLVGPSTILREGDARPRLRPGSWLSGPEASARTPVPRPPHRSGPGHTAIQAPERRGHWATNEGEHEHAQARQRRFPRRRFSVALDRHRPRGWHWQDEIAYSLLPGSARRRKRLFPNRCSRPSLLGLRRSLRRGVQR